MSGLAINASAAVFSSANVVGSVLPKPAFLQQLAAYGAGGATVIAGRSTAVPVEIGSPTLNPYSIIGSTANNGFDTGVPDAIQKTMVLLAKLPAAAAIGMGVYSTFGDTTLFNLNGAGANASFGAYANAGGSSDNHSSLQVNAIATNAAAFYMFVADYTASSVQAKIVAAGAVTDGPVASTGRAVTTNTIRVGADYDPNSQFVGSIEVAATAIVSGANLTDADLLQLYAFFQSFYGSEIVIG